MELLTACRCRARVCGPRVQRVREAERVLVAFQDPACGRALEMVHDRVGRETAGSSDANGFEPVTDDRGEGEYVLRRPGKLGETFGHGVGDLAGTGRLERGDGARLAPLRFASAQLMHDVLDEERIAACNSVDAVLDLARRLRESE